MRATSPARDEQLLPGRLANQRRLRLHEAGRGDVYIWPVRFTAVLVREAGDWRFHQAHFSFPTLRFPDERWTELPRAAARRVDATAD